MSVRVKFLFVAIHGEDTKTTIQCVQKMQVAGEDNFYIIPNEKSHLSLHTILTNKEPVKKARKTLKKRWDSIVAQITLTEEEATKYFDEDQNPQFDNELLHVCNPNFSNECFEVPVFPDKEVKKTSKDHSSNQLPHEPTKEVKPLSTIVKDILIDKFNRKTTNPKTWLATFESECQRVKVPNDRIHDALRLFLEGSALDWHAATSLTINSNDWTTWTVKFNEAFACKGWSDVVSAYSYSYIKGSLSDYALKKLNLIVNVEPKTNEEVKVNLITVGLPSWARAKLERNEITTVGKLLQKLGSLENFSDHHPEKNKSLFPSNRKNWTKTVSEPCPYCLKKGFSRLHAEEDCRQKKIDEYRKNNRNNNNYAKHETKSPFRVNVTETEKDQEETKN